MCKLWLACAPGLSAQLMLLLNHAPMLLDKAGTQPCCQQSKKTDLQIADRSHLRCLKEVLVAPGEVVSCALSCPGAVLRTIKVVLLVKVIPIVLVLVLLLLARVHAAHTLASSFSCSRVLCLLPLAEPSRREVTHRASGQRQAGIGGCRLSCMQSRVRHALAGVVHLTVVIERALVPVGHVSQLWPAQRLTVECLPFAPLQTLRCAADRKQEVQATGQWQTCTDKHDASGRAAGSPVVGRVGAALKVHQLDARQDTVPALCGAC